MLDLCTNVGFFLPRRKGGKTSLLPREAVELFEARFLEQTGLVEGCLPTAEELEIDYFLDPFQPKPFCETRVPVIDYLVVVDKIRVRTLKPVPIQSTQPCMNWGTASPATKVSTDRLFHQFQSEIVHYWELPAHLLPVPRDEITVTNPSQRAPHCSERGIKWKPKKGSAPP